MYSNYKSHNTVKYLIGITPGSTVSFLPYGWGGPASDKMITLNSGFLEILAHGDCILVDRSFLIEEELAARGTVLRIPAFTQGKNNWQLEVLIYIDKLFTFGSMLSMLLGNSRNLKLRSVIPICIVDLLDEIMIFVCGLINLSPSVVNKKKN